MRVHRDKEGLRLACHDRGGLCTRNARLIPAPGGLNLGAESGRGLAMVDAFATTWGDNGNAEYRTVWLYLAYDLTASGWHSHN